MLCLGELLRLVHGLLYVISTNFRDAFHSLRFPGHKSVSFISI